MTVSWQAVATDPAPAVSVCMSAYNTEAYVGRAIESVLEQTISDVELVVLDNASTDGTWETISSYAEPRLQPHRVDENLGASGGRAFAIERAKGRWVAVLDSDDWMDPARLERLVNLGDETGADIVADDVHLIDDGSTEPWSTLFSVGAGGLEQVRRIDAAAFVESDRWTRPGLRLGLTKPLFRGTFLDAHPDIRPDPDLTIVHDFWWVLDALIAGADLCLTPEPGYYYRARAGQLVASDLEEATLDQQIEMADRTLEMPQVRADAALTAALRKSRQVWYDARSFVALRRALRDRRFREAAHVCRAHPPAMKTALASAPGWLRRKLSRDDFASHMTRRF